MIALIQETMLANTDKLYIKNYRIYRADNQEERRKGVLILINDLLDVDSYKIQADTEGRYVKVKLRDTETGKEQTISSVYVEPEQEKNMKLIPSEIWDANIIGGDMNGLLTNKI